MMGVASSYLLGADNVAAMVRRAVSVCRAVDKVIVLRDGEKAFPAMMELIASAKRSVVFENFIFAGDETGKRFARVLGDAVRRGVDVRVLYDPVGTMMVKGGSIAKTLMEEGVPARAFRPVSLVKPWTWRRLRHRDHRKTMVVDGEVAVVGGLCISDNWSGTAFGGKDWRDTALEVRGDVVADVAAAFERMWRVAVGEVWSPPLENVSGKVADGAPCAMVVADHPGAHHVAGVYLWLAEHAQESLEITDAYLVTPEPVVAAFEAAARRGVKVSFLLPGNNNHPFAAASARCRYERLLQSGARIHEWRGKMVHAKTAVADRAVALVGSSNLDPLSMTRNYELNLLIADVETGKAMGEMFERDLEGAREVHLEEWDKRPLWQKAAESAARIFDGNL